MNIVVLNGSPKGMTSITMQYVLFLKKKFPQHQFEILDVCRDIKKLEQDAGAFREVLAAVEAADAVLWAFPLYVLMVHGHYKRFIELIFERNAQAVFRNKYAAILTTSIRFFDFSAHEYMSGVCDDFDMQLAGVFSASMYDLLEAKERTRLLRFAEGLFIFMANAVVFPKRHEPLRFKPFCYAPQTTAKPITGLDEKKILILADIEEEDLHAGKNLAKMIGKFRSCLAAPVELINLRQIKISTGCLGCIRCSFDNVCAFREADDVYAVYRKLIDADALVFAGEIHDRFLSSLWKMFWDRGFFHNHVPMFPGKQMGWLVSGPLKQIPNLRLMLECYVAMQPANLFGIVTDECADSAELDRQLESLAARLAACTSLGYIGTPNFFTVAGGKIFRDEIWSGLRMVFQADHRYYKKHGLYQFPKRSLKVRFRDALFTLLMKIPSFRKDFQNRMKSEMIKPLEKVIAEA